MIRFLSQRKNVQRWIWIGVSVFVVFGMVIISGLPSRGSLFGSASTRVDNAAPIAKVSGEEITAREYISGLDSMMQAYQGMLSRRGSSSQMDYNSLKGMGLDKTLLDSLIRKKLVALEVDRLGLQPTDAELQTRIREQFSTDGKWIGFDKYKKFIERSGQTVSDFEASMRDLIAEEKLRGFITSAIQVSPQEVEEQYVRENTTWNVIYSVVDPAQLKDKVTETDADLRTFFDSKKSEFRIDNQQYKVDYLFISQDAVGKTLQITDDELKKDYDPEKLLASVRVSQIMLKVLAATDQQTVKSKADELVARARGAAGTTPEDFAALARGNSQDTATKDKGGDLGFINKEAIKTGSYLQRALTMKVGEVSDPIKDGNNYYILKVAERKNKTFEEARETLLASARNRLSYKRASEIADEAAKRFNETKDIKAVANEVAQKANMKPEEVLRQTPFFAEGDEVPNIGSNPTFEETVATLKKPGDIGVKIGIRGGFAIPQLVDTRAAHDADFEEVKEKVRTRYKQEKSKDLAAEQARQLVASAANNAETLKTAAEKAGFKSESRAEFRDGQSLENFGSLSQVTTVILGLKEGEVIKEPIFGNEKYLVLGVTKRVEPDRTKYNEQSKAIKERLLEDRRQLTYDSYMTSLKKKLEKDGKINVYKETIEQIFASTNPPAGGQE
ncbi:MAG: SurA N-terminal domain-containing protein [Acidobacteriota bacterium]